MNLATATGFLEALSAGEVVIPRIRVAETFWQRGIGLMGRTSVPRRYGAGLFFPNSKALHTCFMRFPLHILFLDGQGQVVGVQKEVSPYSIAKGPKGTRHCLELHTSNGLPGEGGALEWRSAMVVM